MYSSQKSIFCTTCTEIEGDCCSFVMICNVGNNCQVFFGVFFFNLIQSGEEAFSDDEVPEDIKSDPFFQDSDQQQTSLKKKTKGTTMHPCHFSFISYLRKLV